MKVVPIFALVFCVISLDAVKFRCDYAYSSVGWLKYHEIPEIWKNARLRCRYEGGMLASAVSSEMKIAMMNAIRDVDIFTGIHATVSTGSYYTVDGISLDAISHTWAENEPDNKNNAEHCIAMNGGGNLSDVNCDIPRPYMCYRANTFEDVNACGTPDAEYRLDRRTNKCYKFHTTKRPFKRAHFVCSAEGGHLVIINSDLEAQVIKDLFAQYPANKIKGKNTEIAFIGFHNYGENQDWTTLFGQSLEEAGYSRFSPGQPDNATSGEYCGSVFRSSLLNDLRCDMDYPFICEKDPNHPAVCDTDDFTEQSTARKGRYAW